jgi:opacity protein-like surface antigen
VGEELSAPLFPSSWSVLMTILDSAGRGPAEEGRASGGVGFLAALLLPVLSLLLLPVSGTAQASGPSSDPGAYAHRAATASAAPAAVTLPGQSPDFLFRRPAVSVGVRAGLFQWRAQGQLYDFTVEQFTADRSDFRGGDLGLEVGLWPSDRWGITLGVDGTSTTLNTEHRLWEEVDGTPIFQSTRLRQGPTGSLGVRGYLLPRGEQLSRFAWVPARAAPFVSGGLGFTSYAFEQEGDFVEETDEGTFIFGEQFESRGSSFVSWLGGGAEVSLTPRLALTLEGRYQWGEDDQGGDFRSFEPIDLSGLRLTAGLSVRF